MSRFLGALIILACLGAPVAHAAENLLRNGSFEGSTLYWHNLDPKLHVLAQGEGKVGEFAMKLSGGFIMSAPFKAERGKVYTVSLWVRGEAAGRVGVSMPPSAREEGTRARRLWTKEAGQGCEITTEWQRVSFSWPADVPQSGFWPLPHYIVQISGNKGNTVYVDGVTVVEGSEGTPDYLPRRPLEIIASCPDLPGYEGAKANLFERGATVGLTAHASNPGTETETATLRWQLIDFEGIWPLADPIDRAITLEPGQTLSETVPMVLTTVGCVIGRVSLLDAAGEEIDRSDFPLTSLPYPKAATAPDWRERFGGSFAGGKGCVEKFQKIGFGWIRWRPHANGEDHLPKKPEPGAEWEWVWFDDILKQQEALGQSSHICLYPPPKWIMGKGKPLPEDMLWPADDPRWQDLSVETVWDTFVKTAVEHYKGYSVVYEIENEPEFDKWGGKEDQYVQFTIRTARQIRQADPKAKIMINNVYGIPSGVNSHFFKAGGLKYIDIISWHDYHASWLGDASTMRRARQNLNDNGGEHVEIWFNEGWSFTNTLVDEEISCSNLTSAENTTDMMASIAELSVTGQEKTVLFHVAYEQHGMSFWDYSGPGTMLWDWYNYPLPAVAAWNVMAHHIGISEEVGFVRPPGANFAVFDDLRNGRGVVIAYTDRDAAGDVSWGLPDFGTPMLVEDIMGNVSPAPEVLVLPKGSRLVYLYSADKVPGKVLLEALEASDRRHASFVSAEAGVRKWALPADWSGTEAGSSEGSVVMLDEQPLWKAEQVWPPDPMKATNYVPMTWNGTQWSVKENGYGGQPQLTRKGRDLEFGTRAPHGKPALLRTCALTFVAPAVGTYLLDGTVSSRMWDGKNTTTLLVLRRRGEVVEALHQLGLKDRMSLPVSALAVELEAGDQLSLVPVIQGSFSGGSTILQDFTVTLKDDATALAYRLPAAWEGSKKGTSDGNPIEADGVPIWRLDQVYPDKPEFVANYGTMPWDGVGWHALEHQQGGQPSAKVSSGTAVLSVAGPWANSEYQKLVSLAFIAPKSGVYRVRGVAHAKPWTGNAARFTLSVRKKDTQRAAEVEAIALPRDDTPVSFDFTIDLTAGHELHFLPLMPDWNNATNIWIEGLSIQPEKQGMQQ